MTVCEFNLKISHFRSKIEKSKQTAYLCLNLRAIISFFETVKERSHACCSQAFQSITADQGQEGST